jgi:hypothetical protein
VQLDHDDCGEAAALPGFARRASHLVGALTRSGHLGVVVAQSDVLDALRALGGRASTVEIRVYLESRMPRFSWGGLTAQIRTLERIGDLRAVKEPVPGVAGIWELVK